MNSTISKYWNTFQQECPLCVSSNPQNILFANNVPWNKFQNGEVSALTFPLNQLEILGNPLPSVNDYLVLVDNQFEPHYVIQVTHLEVLPLLALESDMLCKIGNPILWKNYFAKDLLKVTKTEQSNPLVIYLEFIIVY